MIAEFSAHVSQGGTVFTVRDAILLLLRLSGSPLDLLTDISLNCDDEVLHVCETIREELSNPQNETSKMDIGGLFRPFDIDQHVKEKADERASVAKKYLGDQREWINE